MKNLGAVNQFDILENDVEFVGVFEFDLEKYYTGVVHSVVLTENNYDGYYIENISLDCENELLNFQTIYIYADDEMVTFARIDRV
jgi:hypothetical protein